MPTIKFKPGPSASAKTVKAPKGFAGFDGMHRTCVKYSTKSVSGKGQARQQLRCVKYKKGAGKPPCVGAGRKVKSRSPGLLRGSLDKPYTCGRAKKGKR